MIRQLSIRNYVLIDSLDLRFDGGLTIITGETGAGKSILLGALGLILGERAETGTHFDPDQRVLVEATFDIAAYGLEDLFHENDLDYDPELLIRREINPQGRSRAFVNDSPVSLQVLKELGKRLIDIHQQFDQLDVLEPAFQLRMLDALAGQRKAAADCATLFGQWKETQAALTRLRTDVEAAAQEREFLEFQLEELRGLAPRSGELGSLESEARTLRHAGEIRKVLEEAQHFLLEDDRSALEQLRVLARSIQPLAAFHEGLAPLVARLESQIIELRDWAEEASALAERTEGDPERLSVVEERLDRIAKLLMKHRVADTDGLLARMTEFGTRLDALEHSGENLQRLESENARLEAAYRAAAADLRKGREAAAPPFVERLQGMLAGLGMERTRLRLAVVDAPTPTSTGLDLVVFEMAQQEGAKFASVRQAASGGELSRLTLVIKSLVAAAIPLPTLVFDEIDAGVSGAVSMKVGDILTRMATGHQLIVITHSPQIAARADKHLFVSKAPQGGQVLTRVSELQGEDRVRALATMLSTDPPTPAALANARELMGVAG